MKNAQAVGEIHVTPTSLKGRDGVFPLAVHLDLLLCPYTKESMNKIKGVLFEHSLMILKIDFAISAWSKLDPLAVFHWLQPLSRVFHNETSWNLPALFT